MKLDPHDHALLHALRDALAEQEDTPRFIRDMGYAAFSWRTVDEELADVIFDSLSAADLLASATRSEQATVRAITYAGADVTLELEVRAHEVVGQLIPADHERLEVLLPDGSATPVAVDDLGYFVVTPLPQGPFRLRVGAARPVSTPWLDLTA